MSVMAVGPCSTLWICLQWDTGLGIGRRNSLASTSTCSRSMCPLRRRYPQDFVQKGCEVCTRGFASLRRVGAVYIPEVIIESNSSFCLGSSSFCFQALPGNGIQLVRRIHDVSLSCRFD
ncbi:hypothetical protein C8F04DRAFT_525017 [Mycena alexandri]|uniref:Uncharacterized protein n=1 Tax=Mycena alexandri TaxID=1745969 RepID=A0AAD6XEA4_9AGAR|nr:hypothetical protein C8F04DRAFT_525017 [Mycena alexandri]